MVKIVLVKSFSAVRTNVLKYYTKHFTENFISIRVIIDYGLGYWDLDFYLDPVLSIFYIYFNKAVRLELSTNVEILENVSGQVTWV